MLVSGLVITYNEQEHIEACIQSLQRVADEVIVVDSFSSDDTVSICERLGAIVIQKKYSGQIEQKNFALTHANNDYILALDGDEVLTDHLIQSILSEKKKGFPHAGYLLDRLTNYNGKWIKHGGWYPDWKLRLWNRKYGLWGGQNPHDKVTLTDSSTPIKLTGHLLHYGFSSPKEHALRIENYASIGAQSAFDSGKRTHLLHPLLSFIWKFIRDYLLLGGFLDGYTGMQIAILSATSKYQKYQKLLKLQKQAK